MRFVVVWADWNGYDIYIFMRKCYEQILKLRRCVVLPGLINSHTHLYQNLLKGLSPGLPLVPWCNQVLFPALDVLRKGMKKHGSRLAYLWTALATNERIRGGVASCVDMDAVSPEILRAWQEIGFRGVLAYTLANKWVPPELRASEESMKQQVLEFVQAYHHPYELTTVFVAPSTLFLCSDDFLLWAGEQARKYDLGMQIHLAEISGEVDDQKEVTGHTPVEHLQYLGLLNSRLSAVHCVHLGDHDIELMAKAGVQAVHCPKSNMKLADGAAPIVRMREAGIPVGLGTDGCASNDLLDMWEEMRAAVLLARVSTGRAEAMMPREAFQMATVDAARVSRLDAGELQPGKLADIAVLELQGIHLQPFNDQDLLNMLVFCARASDVRDTIINGVTVMRNRRLTHVDEAALVDEVEAIQAEVANQYSEESHYSKESTR
ncbi:MAG: amidohydrolase [Chloroflexi bacterium]|nr:amidohydrolase [Chloroflexota bacterium]